MKVKLVHKCVSGCWVWTVNVGGEEIASTSIPDRYGNPTTYSTKYNAKRGFERWLNRANNETSLVWGVCPDKFWTAPDIEWEE